jgi:PKD domain
MHIRLVGFLTLCAVGAAAPAALAAPTWLPAAPLSDPTHPVGGYRNAVAMNPAGDVAATWGEANAIAVVVRPRGGSFSQRAVISTAGDNVSTPAVAINASGAVAVAWLDSTTTQYEVSARPAGGSFSAPVQAGSYGTTFPQFVSVAIDDAGDVLVGIVDYDGAHFNASYGWRPAGGTFSKIKLNTDFATDATTPVVAMDGAGDAIIAWSEKTSASGSHYVMKAMQRPAGGAFGAPQPLSDSAQDAYAQAVAIGAGGQSAVAWERSDGANTRIQVSSSPSSGSLLSAAQTVSRAGVNASYPALAVNATGHIVAAWADSSGEVAGGGAGGSFGLVTALDPSSGEMAVAIDDAGDSIVTWGENHSLTSGLEAVTRSAAGAVSAPVPLSDPDSLAVFGNVPTATVAMDPAGDAVVGWTSLTDNVYRVRIYDATGPALSLTGPASITAGQSAAFSATASDLFSTVASTSWTFGDGSTGAGSAPAHVYAAPGTYTVTATATDAAGNATSSSRQITVVAAPSAAPIPTAIAIDLPRKCVVPRLSGLSRAAASRRLSAAHCKLGAVHIAKRYRHAKRLVVSVQGSKAGKQLDVNAKVSITLKPAPPPKSHKKH